MAKIIGNTTTTPMLVDQEYNPKSKKPQSGKAVAQALKNIQPPEQDLSDYYTKKETDNKIGNIETALDGIIAIQNTLIGGDS